MVGWSNQPSNAQQATRGASAVGPTVQGDGGPLRVCTWVVVSKLGFGDSSEAIEFYARDLVTSMRIGDSDKKREALRALNETME